MWGDAFEYGVCMFNLTRSVDGLMIINMYANSHAAGLCYTKLEKGAPSFGACCFDEDGTACICTYTQIGRKEGIDHSHYHKGWVTKNNHLTT